MAIEGGTADPDGSGDSGQSVPSAVVHLAGDGQFFRGHSPRPAAATTTGPGCREASRSALSGELAFELSQCPKDIEDQTPGRRRGVDAFGEALEADAGGGQVVDRRYQVAQVAPQAVEAPYHEGAAGAEVVEDRFQLGAVVEGPEALSVQTLIQPAFFSASV